MKSTLTLQQGLEEFSTMNEKYFSKREFSQEGEDFLTSHDVAHVVFGCDTTLFGEGAVKIWTTFGTTLSFWQVTKGYNDADAFQLARKFSVGHALKHIGPLLIRMPTLIIRVKRMLKPWPFSDYKQYLNTPLTEIRKEFGIEIL